MGFSFRKSIKVGPARVNLSKSGVGFSVGAGGLRYTKSPKRKKSSPKKSGSFLGKVFCSGLLFLALLGLAVSYWEWVVAGLAVAAVCIIAVAVYRVKKAQAEEPSEPTTEKENTPVP